MIKRVPKWNKKENHIRETLGRLMNYLQFVPDEGHGYKIEFWGAMGD